MSSDIRGDNARCEGVEAPLEVNDEIELIAAFFRAWSELERLDLRLIRGFGVDGLLVFGGDNIKPSSGSSSSGSDGTRGCCDAQSSATGRDLLDFSLFKLRIDLRLRSDSGVEGLPLERIDLSSASNDGIDSAEVVRVCRQLSSGRLSVEVGHGSSLPSISSNSMLNAGLLL